MLRIEGRILETKRTGGLRLSPHFGFVELWDRVRVTGFAGAGRSSAGQVESCEVEVKGGRTSPSPRGITRRLRPQSWTSRSHPRWRRGGRAKNDGNSGPRSATWRAGRAGGPWRHAGRPRRRKDANKGGKGGGSDGGAWSLERKTDLGVGDGEGRGSGPA